MSKSVDNKLEACSLANEKDSSTMENSNNDEQTKVESNNNDEGGDFVSKKAYSDVTSDMHKYKGKLKDTEAALNQLVAEKEASAREQLAEQGKWEELYTKNQQELEALKVSRVEESNKFIDYHKRNTVLSLTEGFKKDEYNKFINTDSIQMDDNGAIDQESLQAEVDRIKQEYPELLKNSPVRTPPNEAPSNKVSELDPNELTDAQKDQYFKEMLKNK